jgi:hypothetical protein
VVSLAPTGFDGITDYSAMQLVLQRKRPGMGAHTGSSTRYTSSIHLQKRGLCSSLEEAPLGRVNRASLGDGYTHSMPSGKREFKGKGEKW